MEELDAAMFLATVWRAGLSQRSLAGETSKAEEAFLAEMAGLLVKEVLAWHRSAALLRLADLTIKPTRRHGNWQAQARGLLAEAAGDWNCHSYRSASIG